MEKNLKDILGNLDNQDIEVLKNSYNSFKDYLIKIKEGLSQEQMDNLNDFFMNILNHISEGFKFRLEFVVDTNIIFAEIRAILKGNPSFLRNIINLPFLKLFAPPKIREELFNVIDRDLLEDLDKNKAYSLAESFLIKIVILNEKNVKAWNRAYSLLAEYDKDDVHFLALAISLGAHGIITKDKHFEKQDEIKVWTLGECGRTAVTVSHGALSFYILDRSLDKLIPKIIDILFLFYNGFLEFCNELFDIAKETFYELKNKYSNLPKWVKIGIPIASIAIPSIILVTSKKARNHAKNFFINLGDHQQNYFKGVYDDIKYNIKIFIDIVKELTLFIDLGIDVMGYLFYSAHLLLKNKEKFNGPIGI